MVVVEFDRPVSAAVIEPAIALLSRVLTLYLREHEAVNSRLRSDPLTALGNRLAADDALATLRPGDCVIVIDIDHFKNANDLLGHAGGDAVLRHVAAFLRTQLRSTDIICRYGGDEFLVVVPHAERPDTIIETIMRRWADTDPIVTFSCGLATYTTHDDPRAVLERADQALYQAKRNGRAQFAMYAPSLPQTDNETSRT